MKVSQVKDNIEILDVVNEQYGFVLTRTKGSKYAIKAVQRRGLSPADDNIIEQSIGDAMYCLLGAYDFYGRTVWGLVRDPGFTITKIEELGNGTGEDRIRVEFDYSPENKSEKVNGIKDWTINGGYLVFQPNDGWKLIEYSRGYHPGTVQGYPRTIDTVDDCPDGQLQFTDYAVAKLYAKDGKTVGLEDRVRRVKSSYGPIPKEHFYLSHYGFPEPNFGSKRYWLWMLGGLIGGIACIVASRRLLKR
ncbi:MAG: hypothetical protein KF752_14910 [Pirellulaceae bacterium]|nr:hypothetical protein [Pirellulaceae bacterium]